MKLYKRERDKHKAMEDKMDTFDFCASFLRSTHISIPEAVMFICFGVSWPVSVMKALRTKKVTGKSPLFMALIIIGYLSGIAHKIIFSRDILIILYLFNLSMVVADLGLYLRYHASEQNNASSYQQWGLRNYLFLTKKMPRPDSHRPAVSSAPTLHRPNQLDHHLGTKEHKCFSSLG
jgi:hypothetical protein